MPSDLVSGFMNTLSDDAQKWWAWLVKFCPELKSIEENYHKMQEEEAKFHGQPEYKKFRLKYEKIMPQIEVQVDEQPLSDAARDQHRRLIEVLGIADASQMSGNMVIRLLDQHQLDAADKRLDRCWDITKKFHVEQSLAVKAPGFQETLKKAIEMSKGDILQFGNEALGILANIVDLGGQLDSLHSTWEPLLKTFVTDIKIIKDEFDAIKQTAEDVRNGYKVITGADVAAAAAAETGVGPALAAILDVAVITGLGLEITATIIDFIGAIQKLAGSTQASQTAAAAKQVTSIRADFSKIETAAAKLIKQLEPIAAYGRKLRKLLHKK